MIGFIFRSDGTGNNEYVLQIQNGGGKLKLIKRVDGVDSDIEMGTASLVTVLEMINRIKVVVSGTSIKAYIDGQLQIDSVDVSFNSGTHIGFYGEDGANTDIRLFSMRLSDTVTITNLVEGTEIELMADGGICAATTLSNSGGVASFVLNHWPMESFYINSVNYPINGGIWGGDEYRFSGSLPTNSIATIISASVEELTPTLVEVTYSEALNESSIPDVSAFTLAGKTISNVSISGTKITLTVTVEYEYGDAITLNYTIPYQNRIKTVSGNAILSFTGQVVTNNMLEIVAYDTFTDADGVHLHDHIMDLGAGWVDQNGNWVIASNAVNQTTAANVWYVTHVNTGILNLHMLLDITMPNSTAYGLGCIFRYQDSTHYWIAGLARNGGSAFVQVVSVGGGSQTIATNITHQAGVSHTLRIIVNGNVITAYYDGNQVGQITDSYLNDKTIQGLGTYMGGGYIFAPCDNFIIKTL